MSSVRLKGLIVSPGIAIAEPVVQETRQISSVRLKLDAGAVEKEIARFESAISVTRGKIQENGKRAAGQLGDEYGAIFEAHDLIAQDPSLVDGVCRIIREEGVNAEWALERVIEKIVAQFQSIEDDYLSERKLDVLDVGGQILHCLYGHEQFDPQSIDRSVIVVADDLPPSVAVKLPLDKVCGFILESGGPTSHTTIIARSFGIPVLVGVHGACAAAMKAERVIIDAFEGKSVFDPDSTEIAEFNNRNREHQKHQSQLEKQRNLPSETRDGVKINLLANVDLELELDAALYWNAEGIGLYRSEFLYMERSPSLPSEDEHFEIYCKLLAALDPKPVVIRTFDLGGKKLAREVMGGEESNPVLGLRGIRLCFAKPGFFKTQLRALIRAAAEFAPGRLRIMFPLISCIEEFLRARLLVEQLVEELGREGVPLQAPIPMGAMVEVPSAAIMAEELAQKADFLSIGTNDLIQYSLAVDRANEEVASLYRPTSPALLRLISGVVKAGSLAGIDVGMCGEMASDPLMVPLLIGMGLRKFSMNPQAIPLIRSQIRRIDSKEKTKIASQALQMTTAREVEEFLLEKFALSLARMKIQV